MLEQRNWNIYFKTLCSIHQKSGRRGRERENITQSHNDDDDDDKFGGCDKVFSFKDDFLYRFLLCIYIVTFLGSFVHRLECIFSKTSVRKTTDSFRIRGNVPK